MALRHRFPFRVLPELRLESEPELAPPLLKKPKLVTFRASTDVATVVEEMAGYVRVRLQAAVGAGKSTRLPLALEKSTGALVVHMFPSEFMAVDAYDYLSRGPNGDKYSLAVDDVHVLPSTGVVLTTYAWVCGWWLTKKHDRAPFGNAVMYADEVHESDAYSEVVRTLGPSIPGIRCFIETSATHDAGHLPMPEMEGDIVSNVFDRVSPGSWDPSDPDQPWSITELGGNLLVFLDDDKTAASLIEKYTMAGARAFRFHSRMDRQVFQVAMRAMRDPKEGIVVVVADYSFRNAFTFEISRTIDSGLVAYTVVKDGLPKKMFRTVFDLEKYQGSARGGRTKGSRCEYFFPKGLEVRTAICSLEGVEVEGAALLYRMFGYAPPTKLRGIALMAVGLVPKDLPDALNGFVPLTLLPEGKMHSLVMEKPESAAAEVAEVLGSYGIEDSPVAELDNLFEGLDVAVKSLPLLNSSLDVLEQLQSVSAAATVLEYGRYYSCAGLGSPVQSQTDWKLLVQMILENPVAILGYERDVKLGFVQKLLLEYNTLAMHGAATAKITAHEDMLAKLSHAYPDIVKRWSGWLFKEAREKQGLARSVLKALEVLREPSMHFSVVPPDERLERKLAEELVAVLQEAVRTANAQVDTGQFFEAVRENVGMIGPPDDVKLITDGVETISLEPDRLRCKIALKPVKVGKATRQDLYLRAHDPLSWDVDCCVDAITEVLRNRGMAVSAINKLKLIGMSLDPNKVMQLVRNRGPKKGRKLSFDVAMTRA